MKHVLVKRIKILRKKMFVAHTKRTKKTMVYHAADIEQTLEGIFTAEIYLRRIADRNVYEYDCFFFFI